MRVTPRLVGTWIALTLVSGVAGAGAVSSRSDGPPPAAVTTFDPRASSTTVPDPTTTMGTAPSSTDGPPTSTSAPGRSTTTTPRATSGGGVPQIDQRGLWVGAVDGSSARRVAAECAGGALEWRHDGSAVDELVPVRPPSFTFWRVLQHGLDGSSQTVSTGPGFTRSGSANLAAWLSEDVRTLTLTDSDLRSHRVTVPTPQLADPTYGGNLPTLVLRPDGGAVALVTSQAVAIYGRDGTLLQPWTLVESGFITWTTDQRWLLEWVEGTGLMAAHPDGTGVHTIDVRWRPPTIALGPGASFAYVDGDPDGDSIPDTTGTTRPQSSVDRIPIVVVDAAAGTSRRIVQGTIFDLAWSPTGGPIVWAGTRDGTYALWATSPDGATTRMIAASTKHRVELPQIHDWTWEQIGVHSAVISPDGRSWAACA